MNPINKIIDSVHWFFITRKIEADPLVEARFKQLQECRQQLNDARNAVTKLQEEMALIAYPDDGLCEKLDAAFQQVEQQSFHFEKQAATLVIELERKDFPDRLVDIWRDARVGVAGQRKFAATMRTVYRQDRTCKIALRWNEL